MANTDQNRPARAELAALIQKNRGPRLRTGLGHYLHQLARGAVAAALVAGCSMSHVTTGEDAGDPNHDAGMVDGGMVDAGQPPGPDSGLPLDAGPPPFDAGRDAMPPEVTLCSADGQWQALANLDMPDAPAYLGLYDGGGFDGQPQLIDSIGTPCADASDRAACDAAYETSANEWWGDRFLVTDGDDVSSLASDAERRPILGPINTPHEAALVVWSAGQDIWCAGEFISSVTTVAAGWEVVAYSQGGGCGTPWTTTRYRYHVAQGTGMLTLLAEDIVRMEEDFGCVGRRPAGLQAAEERPSPRASVGGFFADVTRLEESAVAAFERMIAELESLGAPEVLRSEAAAARDDEIRHTASMGAIAERYGVSPGRPVIDAAEERSAFDIALENAVEGCVRETYGALVGAHQALSASDPEIAAAMRGVADDEIRHAELSWALAGWLEPQLTDDERSRIERAKREAVEDLRLEARRAVDPSLVNVAGLPAPATAIQLVEQLAMDLWA